ncbi:hypothetical protein [Methylobacter sp.]|uniref:hypothetical protein n=1 Tax=Methylobacter sp. TaxID=2051955 RepID=UPI00121C5CBF|nr:hypothetical protein [Methylobacter sp.]TAK62300.1 MAG: hypothetical protein EPO18_10880 [Methylobacter sp.]
MSYTHLEPVGALYLTYKIKNMKKNTGKIVLVVGVILMTGCAQTIYVKPGATPAQLAKDNADCQYDVVKNTPTYDGVSDPIAAGIAMHERKQAILEACYASKGYRAKR